MTDEKRTKPKQGSAPPGTGEKSEKSIRTTAKIGPSNDPLSLEILTVANTVHVMTVFYSPGAVVGGAITASCELLMGRPINSDIDGDLEPLIKALSDCCLDKREIRREDATNTAPIPKGIM